MAVAKPSVRVRRNSTCARPIFGSSASFSGGPSANWPRGDSCTTKRRKNSSVSLPPRGWNPPRSSSSRQRASTLGSMSGMERNSAEYSSTSLPVSIRVNSGTLGLKASWMRWSRMGW